MVDVHIIKHKDTNKPRGCFVEFAEREDLEKALLKDGTVWKPPAAQALRMHAAAQCALPCPAAGHSQGRRMHSRPAWGVQMVMGRPIRVDVAEDRSERSRSGN